jgi:hypothetical protein
LGRCSFPVHFLVEQFAEQCLLAGFLSFSGAAGASRNFTSNGSPDFSIRSREGEICAFGWQSTAARFTMSLKTAPRSKKSVP